MKKINLLVLLIAISFCSFAQETEKEKEKEKEEKPHGFQKEKLFTGGSVSLGFGNRSTNLGITPHFGYSLNKYFDVAVSLGYNYTSQRDYPYYGDKVRQTIIGPGAFVRVFPVKFLFAQAQYEYNFLNVKYIPGDNFPRETYKVSAPSMLVGAGYTNGRQDGNTFYYLAVMFDIARNENSPYVDELGRVLPIFRAGINIALFQGGGVF